MLDEWHWRLASQQPEHDVASQTHCPALLQCCPDVLHVPDEPTQRPPAPSGPPHATPAQLATRH
jgi:hypothetical protein